MREVGCGAVSRYFDVQALCSRRWDQHVRRVPLRPIYGKWEGFEFRLARRLRSSRDDPPPDGRGKQGSDQGVHCHAHRTRGTVQETPPGQLPSVSVLGGLRLLRYLIHCRLKCSRVTSRRRRQPFNPIKVTSL
ncbi:hypothetical protein GN956_G17130 [Arapaima gigas]